LGQRDPAGDRVAVDGKEWLSRPGRQVVSAYSVRDAPLVGFRTRGRKVQRDSRRPGTAAAGGSRRRVSHRRCAAPPDRDGADHRARAGGRQQQPERKAESRKQKLADRRASRPTGNNSTRVWRTLSPHRR
jgi:hypothetical protein